MSKIMKTNRKNEHKKLIKLVSEQETLIKLLTDYYVRTDYITRDVQDEMFEDPGTEPCECGNEECDELVYPILQSIRHYQYISENFDSCPIEEINLGLSPRSEREESEQSGVLLN